MKLNIGFSLCFCCIFGLNVTYNAYETQLNPEFNARHINTHRSGGMNFKNKPMDGSRANIGKVKNPQAKHGMKNLTDGQAALYKRIKIMPNIVNPYIHLNASQSELSFNSPVVITLLFISSK